MAKANARSKKGPDEDGDEEEVSALDLPRAPVQPLDLRNIRLDEIEPMANIRPAHHGVEGLSETMHSEGQLQPCSVREASPESRARHGKPFELIFGYRRYLAAQSLGWEEIQCVVRIVPDERRLRQLIIENFQREQLSDTSEARAFYELKYSTDPPASNASIARELGCDPSHVSHRLKMLIKLSPKRPEGAAPYPHEVAEAKRKVKGTEDQGPAPEPAVAGEEGAPGEGQATAPPRLEGEELERLRHVAQAPLTTPMGMPGASAPEESSGRRDKGKDGGEEGQGEDAGLDILGLVDEGKISGSMAEIVASLDDRKDQEQLVRLAMRHQWGTKRASQWVRDVKKASLINASDNDAMGPVEMLQMEDVVDLPRLRLREVDDDDVERIVLYSQLRNGMDQEMLDHISEVMGYSHDSLWDYVRGLSGDDVRALKRRMALRYITAAHRYKSLDASLLDDLELPEDAEDEARLRLAQDASLDVPDPEGFDLGDMDEED
jgi:ParB/RepB/Spo0J family partition protein